MNEEKRKIGEYTVLCSVNVGEKEIILRSLSKCNIMLLCEALYQSRKRCIRFGK